MMRRIYYLAELTFREGIRDRALFGVMGMAVVMFLSTVAVVTIYGYDIMKVTLDLNLSVVGFTGLLLCFFINTNILAKDIDKRTIYCVLSKPISRSEYILGKYVGTLALIIFAILLLSTIGAGMVFLIKATRPDEYFKAFSWLCYVQAVAYEIGMFVVLNAVIIFFSAFTSGSFLTLLYSIATYVIGQSIEEVIQFLHSITKGEGTENMLFWNWLQYIFPNFSAFDIKVLTSHGFLMSSSHTMWLAVYSGLYALLLLYFSILLFNRRELQ